MPTALLRLTRAARRLRWLEALAVAFLYGVVRVLAALPTRWVLAAADLLGEVLAVLDRRGRAVAFQNMRVAFRDGQSPADRRRLLRASARNVMRSVLLLLHLQPLTPQRYRAWVEVADLPERRRDLERVRARGAVLVSGHVGNWELLLGLRLLFPGLRPSVFLAEALGHRALDHLLERLRAHGDLRAALRKGGARTAMAVVGAGGTAGLLVDRNVRRRLGGIYVPFMGLEASTTPLPALLALRHEVPLFPVFLLPEDDGRHRLWFGPDLAADLASAEHEDRVRELLGRVNGVLEDVIRARPELWNWTLKRFKSRPQEALAGYPPYSVFDPP